MAKWKKLSHTIYQCKYHIVWCPKYRYRILKGALAEFVEQTLMYTMPMEKHRDPGDEHQRWSCPSHPFCSSQTIGIWSGGNVKRGDSHQNIQKLPYSQEEALLGEPPLKQRILCEYHRFEETRIRNYVQYQGDKEKQEEGNQEEFGLF